MRERRMATPHYTRYKHTAEREWYSLMGVSFVVGAMLGATLAMGFMAL